MGGQKGEDQKAETELMERRRAELVDRIEVAYFGSLSDVGPNVVIERADLKALLSLASASLYPPSARAALLAEAAATIVDQHASLEELRRHQNEGLTAYERYMAIEREARADRVDRVDRENAARGTAPAASIGAPACDEVRCGRLGLFDGQQFFCSKLPLHDGVCRWEPPGATSIAHRDVAPPNERAASDCGPETLAQHLRDRAQLEARRRYLMIVDSLRTSRTRADWKPEDDRVLLIALHNLFDALSPEDQKIANAEGWRSWPDLFDEHQRAPQAAAVADGAGPGIGGPALGEQLERNASQLHTGVFDGTLFDPARQTPLGNLVMHGPYGAEPEAADTDDFAVRVREGRVFQRGPNAFSSMTGESQTATPAESKCQHVFHTVGTNSVCRFCDQLEYYVRLHEKEVLESLPLRLRHAAAGTGGYGPSDLAALLEEAAQVIAAQPGVIAEGEPMHSINMSALDLEDAIQAWAGERYGLGDGFWKATVKAPDGHKFVVAWELEDVPPEKEDAASDGKEDVSDEEEAKWQAWESLTEAHDDAQRRLLNAVLVEDAEWNAKDAQGEAAKHAHQFSLRNARKRALLAFREALRALNECERSMADEGVEQP